MSKLGNMQVRNKQTGELLLAYKVPRPMSVAQNLDTGYVERGDYVLRATCSPLGDLIICRQGEFADTYEVMPWLK